MYYEREGEISRSLFEREGERLRLIKLARYFTTVTVVRVEGRGELFLRIVKYTRFVMHRRATDANGRGEFA